MKYKKSIFWFRQDLRVFDNTGLYECIQQSKECIGIFILDHHAVKSFGGKQNPRFSFLFESLLHLKQQFEEKGGTLLILEGKPEQILPHVIKKYDIDAVFSNKSYSSYGASRDALISDYCKVNLIDFQQFSDYLIIPVDSVEQRKVFTPFYKLWRKYIFSHSFSLLNIEKISSFSIEEQSIFLPDVCHPYFSLKHLKDTLKNFDVQHYHEQRDFPSIDKTSRISVYLRFGLISPRWLYKKYEYKSETFIKELAWREFWHHIRYYFPETSQLEFQVKRRSLVWQNDPELWKKIESASTGYPIIDASIRQLQQENWLHGRNRMILGSFITKNLLLDWRDGERFFKKYLLDYDETVNIGNWQWIASVGADPKPVRIFNPILQATRFDKQAKYIKKYLPELEKYPSEHLLDPCRYELGYSQPIVDQKFSYRRAKEFYSPNNKQLGIFQDQGLL